MRPRTYFFAAVAILALVAFALYESSSRVAVDREPRTPTPSPSLTAPHLRSDGRADELRDPQPSVAREEAVAAPLVAPMPGATSGSVVVHFTSKGAPVANVGIRLTQPVNRAGIDAPQRESTDADGIARFDEVPPASYVVRCDRGPSPRVQVVAGEESRVEIAIDDGIGIEGRVVDEKGQAVAGADVFLSRFGQWEEDAVVATSRTDGAFDIAGLVGNNHIGARKAGYAPSALLRIRDSSGAENAPNAQEKFTLTLVTGGSAIFGRVTDANGQACAHARVIVDPDTTYSNPTEDGSLRRHERWMFTASDGSYRVEGLEPGMHSISFRAQAMAPHRQECTTPRDGATEVNVVLRMGAVIYGIVTDPADPIGRCVAGAQISAETGFFSESSFATSDAQGAYRFDSLPAGEIKIAATTANAPRSEQKATTIEGQATRVDITLRVTLELKGRVADVAGGPIKGARICAISTQESTLWVRETHSTDDGSFSFTGAPDTPLRLIAYWPSDPASRGAEKDDVRADKGEIVMVLKNGP